MCLFRRTDNDFRREYNQKEKGTGYKVFEELGVIHPKTVQLRSYMVDHPQKQYPKGYPLRKWIQDPKCPIVLACAEGLQVGGDPRNVTYVSGFHIFTRAEDAHTWLADSHRLVVYKVEYRQIMAKGVQCHNHFNCLPVVVAREMRILKRMG
jgi:hypothetical protein